MDETRQPHPERDGMAPRVHPLIRKLEQRDTLSQNEKVALENAAARTKEFKADEEMAHQGEEPSFSTLLLEGWAARHKSLRDGRRQILAFHIPGDFIDLHSFPLKVQDHTVVALTPCKVALVAHEDLNRITEDFPHLTRLLWISTLIDGAILREWLLSAGRRSATEHMAGLLCELLMRLKVIGLAQDNSFRLPVTQSELGDALGISTVHTNRVLQELRAKGLVTWKGDLVEINDWMGLCALADFDLMYLHLEHRPR
jgi:CRP-like cAMP-binding protein